MKKILVLMLVLSFALSSCIPSPKIDGIKKKLEEKADEKVDEIVKSIENEIDNTTLGEMEKVEGSTGAEETTSAERNSELKDAKLVRSIDNARVVDPSRSYKLVYARGVKNGGASTTILYHQDKNFYRDWIDEASFHNITLFRLDKNKQYSWNLDSDSKPVKSEGLFSKVEKLKISEYDKLPEIPDFAEYSNEKIDNLVKAEMAKLNGEEVLYMEFKDASNPKIIEKVWYSVEKDVVMKTVITDDKGVDNYFMDVVEFEVGGDYSSMMKLPGELSLTGKELFASIYEAKADNSNRNYMVMYSACVINGCASAPTVYKYNKNIRFMNEDYAGMFNKIYVSDTNKIYTWYDNDSKGKVKDAEDKDKEEYPVFIEDYAKNGYDDIITAKMEELDGENVLYFEAKSPKIPNQIDRVWYSISKDFVMMAKGYFDDEHANTIQVQKLEFNGDYAQKVSVPSNVDFGSQELSGADLVKQVYDKYYNALRDPLEAEFAFEKDDYMSLSGKLVVYKDYIRVNSMENNLEAKLYDASSKEFYTWTVDTDDVNTSSESENVVKDSARKRKAINFTIDNLVGTVGIADVYRDYLDNIIEAKMIDYKGKNALYVEYSSIINPDWVERLWYSTEDDLPLMCTSTDGDGKVVYKAEIKNIKKGGDYSKYIEVPKNVDFNEE